MTDMSRVADHNVIATYRSPSEARAALTALERRGVEAADIELFGPGMDAATLPVTNDDALRATHAYRLCTCGRDGQLRDVA